MPRAGGAELIGQVIASIQDNTDAFYRSKSEYIDAEVMPDWFHPGQKEIWQSKKQTILALCGRQSGKTVTAPYLTLREIQRTFEADGLNEHLVASPSFTLMSSKLLPEYIRLFVDELGIATYHSDPVKELRITPAGIMRLTGQPRGAITIRFGYAAKSETLESATYKSAVCDEAGQPDFKVASDEAIDGRMMTTTRMYGEHQGGRKFILTTPYELGWLKQRYHDVAVAGSSRIDLVRFETSANPSVDVSVIEEQRKILPAWKFDMFYRGIFTRPAGAIYDCFDTMLNVVKTGFRAPEDWPIARGLDFGPNNTAAVVLVGEVKEIDGRRQYTGRWILTKRYLDGGKSSREHANAINALTGDVQFSKGGNHTEQGWRDAFCMAGCFVTEPNVLPIEDQIQIVYQAIVERKLLVCQELQDVIDQIMQYSRELDEYGLPTDKIKDDAKYHFLAALRYVATAIFPRGTGPGGTVSMFNVPQQGDLRSFSYVHVNR